MKNAKMILDKAFRLSEVDREFMVLLLSILEEQYMEEFISQILPQQMKMVFAGMYWNW